MNVVWKAAVCALSVLVAIFIAWYFLVLLNGSREDAPQSAKPPQDQLPDNVYRKSAWQSLHDKRLGLELSYPSDWFHGKTKTGVVISDNSVFVDDGLLAPGGYPVNWLSISAFQTDRTLDEYFTTDVLNKPDVLVLEKTDDILLDFEALRTKAVYRGVNGATFVYFAVYVKRDEDMLIIASIVSEDAVTSKVEETFNAVVESVKNVNAN